jgi:hypothetical protein
MANLIYQIDQELMLLHSTIVSINEGLLALDTALETPGQGPEATRNVVRETTAYAINMIQTTYPLIGSMMSSLQLLGQGGY